MNGYLQRFCIMEGLSLIIWYLFKFSLILSILILSSDLRSCSWYQSLFSLATGGFLCLRTLFANEPEECFPLCKSWIEFCGASFQLFTGMLYGNVLVAFHWEVWKTCSYDFSKRIDIMQDYCEFRKVWEEQMTSFT